MKCEAIFSKRLSQKDTRYVIVDSSTGEILDDAQGYGYKSKQKAYAAYAYKTRDKSKDYIYKQKRQAIQKWLKQNKEFVSLIEGMMWDAVKCGANPKEEVDVNCIQSLIECDNFNPPCTAKELHKELFR